MHRTVVRAAVLLVSMTAASSSLAQQGMGVLFGVVDDGETVEPLEGVVVTATSLALQGTATAVTDAEGRYRIDALPPGSYALSFERAGYQRDAVSGVQVRADATLRMDTILFPGSGEGGGTAAVEVRASTPTIDVGSTSTGYNVDREFTSRVPLLPPSNRGAAQRSFETIAETAPGAHMDSYGVSINGATSPENQYLIDGLGVGNTGYGNLGTPLSLEFIEEMNVITGGYLPEYGHSTGGLLNVVTKSGSNELHGAAFTSVVPGFMEGQRLTPPSVGNTIRTDTNLDYLGDVGFLLGGPIIPDRLWFFSGFAVARTQYTLTRRLFGPDGEIGANRRDLITDETSLQAYTKLTYRLNDENRFSLTAFATPLRSGGIGQMGIDPRYGLPEIVDDDNNIAGDPEFMGHEYRSGAVGGALRWQWDILPRALSLDTSLGIHNELGGIYPNDGSLPGASEGYASRPRVKYRRNDPGFHSINDFEAVPDSAGCEPAGTDAATDCGVPTYQANGSESLYLRSFQRYQLRSVLTWVFDVFGVHVLKAGVDGSLAQYENRRSFGGVISYREGVDGSYYSDYNLYGYMAGPDEPVLLPYLTWRSTDVGAGAFIQDSWTAFDFITLNLGVRYDVEYLFGGDNTMTMGLPNQISPRAGIIYDFTQRGESKIYASYAKYFQHVPLDVADRSGAAEPYIYSLHDPAICNPLDPGQHKGICQKDESRFVLNDPASPDQYWGVISAGKTPVDPDIRAPSTDEIMLGAEYEVLPQARVGANYTRRWLSDAIEDMSRDDAVTYFIGNPGSGIAADFPAAKREYDAVTAYFEKRFSDDWLAEASYTWSYLRGNYSGLFRPETDQLDPNISSDYDLKSLVVNRDGLLPGHRWHSLKVFAAKDFQAMWSSAFTLGAAARAESGRPTNYLGSQALYGEDEAFILPRGAGPETPWVFGFDLHAGYRIPVGDDVTLAFTADVFNLFNFQAATDIDESYTENDVSPIVDGTTANLPDLKNVDGTVAGPEAVNPNFGNPTAYQAPRTFRFGLRAEF